MIFAVSFDYGVLSFAVGNRGELDPKSPLCLGLKSGF